MKPEPPEPEITYYGDKSQYRIMRLRNGQYVLERKCWFGRWKGVWYSEGNLSVHYMTPGSVFYEYCLYNKREQAESLLSTLFGL